MKIIGVTGSSGAGKNVVCEIIEKNYEAEIIDADKIAKQLSKKGTMYLNSIVERFGTGIVNKKGELNRKKLADIIFEDDTKREQLNELTFVYVVDAIQKKITTIKKKVIVINAPLLFESNLDKVCDFVIAVVADKKIQVERIQNRDGLKEEEAEKRINAQNSNEFFEENADYIVKNNGDLEELEKQILKIKI